MQLGKLYPVSPQHLLNILMVFAIFLADTKNYAGRGHSLSGQAWSGAFPRGWPPTLPGMGRVNPQRKVMVHLPDEGQPDVGQRGTTDVGRAGLSAREDPHPAQEE